MKVFLSHIAIRDLRYLRHDIYHNNNKTFDRVDICMILGKADIIRVFLNDDMVIIISFKNFTAKVNKLQTNVIIQKHEASKCVFNMYFCDIAYILCLMSIITKIINVRFLIVLPDNARLIMLID